MQETVELPRQHHCEERLLEEGGLIDQLVQAIDSSTRTIPGIRQAVREFFERTPPAGSDHIPGAFAGAIFKHSSRNRDTSPFRVKSTWDTVGEIAATRGYF